MAIYNTLLIKLYNFPVLGGGGFWFEALAVFLKVFAVVIWLLYFLSGPHFL